MSRENQYITLMLDDILDNERRLQALYTNVVRRQFEFLDEARYFQHCALRFLCSLVSPTNNQEDVSSNETVIDQQPTRLTSSSIPTPSVRRHTIPRRTSGRDVRRRTGRTSDASAVTESIAEIIDTVTQNLSGRTNTAFFGAGNAPVGIRLLAPSRQQIDSACSVLPYRDCSSNQTACPVDMVDFRPNDLVMRINACGHVFREANLRRVFRDSPRCPICRYNIALFRPTMPSLGPTLSATVPQTFSTIVNDNSGNILEFSMGFGANREGARD